MFVSADYLEKKINEFKIDYYCHSYNEVIKVKKFIEDMTTWYELRIPTGEELYNKIQLAENFKNQTLKDKILEEYINLSCSQDELYTKLGLVDNTKIFDVKSFLNSCETNYLKKPKYNSEAIQLIAGSAHKISLTSKGRVRNFGRAQFDLYNRTDGKIYEFNDITIDEFYKFICDKSVYIYKEDMVELERKMSNYEDDYKFKEDLLDTVMYKLIERGGEKCGATRGYMFAKEFGRDTSIPLKYGLLDINSVEIQKALIEDYLNNGGDINLVCYQGRFGRFIHRRNVELWEHLLINEMHNLGMYTEEETELHQRLVNTLVSSINQDELNNEKQEEVTRKRIEKKLNKRK